jgi:hypothetical protein
MRANTARASGNTSSLIPLRRALFSIIDLAIRKESKRYQRVKAAAEILSVRWRWKAVDGYTRYPAAPGQAIQNKMRFTNTWYTISFVSSAMVMNLTKLHQDLSHCSIAFMLSVLFSEYSMSGIRGALRTSKRHSWSLRLTIIFTFNQSRSILS